MSRKAGQHDEKIQFLSQLLYLNAEADRLLDEQAHYEARIQKLERIRECLIGQSNIEQNIDHCVHKVRQLQQSLCALMDELAQTRCAVQQAIGCVEDERYRILLAYRFLNGKTWEEIAQLMHYSYQHVNRLFNQAVKQVDIRKKTPALSGSGAGVSNICS